MNDLPPARKHCSFAGRVGLARADITPPVGIYARNWGAARHDVAESIHRPLSLNVISLQSESGGDPLVLVDADLGWWRPLELFQRLRARLLDECLLSRSQFAFALTHTHAAAPLMDPDPSLAGSDLLEPWLESIYQATVSSIRAALGTASPATLDWHSGRCGLASVRDLPDPDGSVDRQLCGYNPQPLADDTLVVGRVTGTDGGLRAVIVNYACHPTTLAWENSAISPDYVGAMRSTIEQATGASAYFLQGASGDLAPPLQYVGDAEVADRHGRQLAYAALAVLHDMEPAGTQLVFEGVVESGAPLAVWRHRSRRSSQQLRSLETAAVLDLKDWPSAEQLERQRMACDDRAREERLRRRRDIRRSLGDGGSFPVPVHAWRIGDAVLVGCCCEPYSRLQQELRRRFPDRVVICVNLMNGSIGYLPPQELYDLDVYPVWQTPFARGGLEKMIDTMTGAIEELLA